MHAGFDPGKTQHIGGTIESIPLEVIGAASCVLNRIVVSISGIRRAADDEADEEQDSACAGAHEATLRMKVRSSPPSVSCEVPSCRMGEM